MVRLFSADYVTLRTINYESEYVVCNEHQHLERAEKCTELSVERLIKKKPAMQILGDNVISSMISGIVTVCEGANKNCIIL